MVKCSGKNWYDTHKTYKGGRKKIYSEEEFKERRKESTRRYKKSKSDIIAHKNRQYHLDRLEKLAGRPRPSFCECCGGPPNSRLSKKLEYDHNHKTGKFRGWLCRNCNGALGMVKDEISRLEKLISYLQKENQ